MADIIDAHHHLWNYATQYAWIGAAMDVVKVMPSGSHAAGIPEGMTISCLSRTMSIFLIAIAMFSVAA